MKSYKPEDVRVVGLFGHRGSGKTSLAEAVLYNAGATSRLGSVENGNLTLELDEVAVARHTTMGANVGFVEFAGTRISFIDTPGDGNFWGATARALRVVDAGLITVSAPDGLEPITLRVIRRMGERHAPFACMLTKLDKEGADFSESLKELQDELTHDAVAVSLPIGQGPDFKGVVSLLSQKAYLAAEGATTEAPIPEDMVEAANSARELLFDAVAAADDALAERYLEEGTLTEDELGRGLRAAFVKGDLVPVLAGAPSSNVGTRVALELMRSVFPSPLERPAIKGYKSPACEQPVERMPTPDGPLVAQVFRTFYDPFAGMLSYARIWSGSLDAGGDAYNATRSHADRPSHIFLPRGGTKSGEEVKTVTAGDLVVLTKLKITKTGDTLCSKDDQTFLPTFEEPEALLHFGLDVKEQKDEDKVGSLIHKLTEEDPSLHYELDPEAKETLLGGLGQAHIDYVVERLRRAHIEVGLHEPKVPYRETIRGTINGVEGKHKKQTGGSGQFGVCFINVEPSERGEGFVFVDKIVGGSIPRQYVQSVEKGIRDFLKKGPLSGNQVVDVKVTLYDGKYHRVDSSDMAFQQAGRKAIKAALADGKAKLVLLEPYMELDIQCPADGVGDVMGDLNSRRARVNNMTTEGKRGKINAFVPMNEILRYTNVLKSITSGRGSFTMHFSRYEEAPANVQQEVSTAYQASDDAHHH